MREKFFQSAHGLCRQTFKNVFEIVIRIVSVELGGLDEAHDRRDALAGA